MQKPILSPVAVKELKVASFLDRFKFYGGIFLSANVISLCEITARSLSLSIHLVGLPPSLYDNNTAQGSLAGYVL